MPGYAPIHPIVGGGPFNELWTPDTTQKFPAGMTIDAVDNYFGAGKFMYLKSGAAMDPGRLVIISDQTFVTADLADTAALGHPFLVARQVFSAADQWGWFQFQGVTPIQVAASVAAGVAIGIGAAGQGGTNSAGKQLLNTRVLKASTFTLTKTGTTQIGAVLALTNVNGLFKGLVASGTGVAGGSTIASVDPSGRYVTLSADMTAVGTVTITFTYTGFVLAHIACPFGQGVDAT